MATLRAAFGRTVRELRLELGLSQEKLAQKVKVSRNFLGSVERGESSLSLEAADRFAKAASMRLSDFA
jgi:transcriptional regulator with XRE-family HTH domain